MTLGLTDGNINSGLYASGVATVNNVGNIASVYGANVGSAGSNYINSNKSLGVTTDPTKSGIETSANGLYLYFYVGAVVQDASVIAAASVLTDVANLKTNKAGLPDYNNGILITGTSYTAPEAGFVTVHPIGGVSGIVYVNGARVGIGSATQVDSCVNFNVDKGDIITLRSGYNFGTAHSYFYPFKI